MRKLFLLPLLLFAFYACEKDDDSTEPEKTNTNTQPTYNTEYIFTADTSIKQIFYTDSEGDFKVEISIDPTLRTWSKKLNNSIGDTIYFGGNTVTFTNKAEIEVIYTGDGSLDTIFSTSSNGSAAFKAAVVP